MGEMLDSVEAFLEKHNFRKAAQALRAERQQQQRRRSTGSSGSPSPTTADASDSDVALYLQMAQKGRASSGGKSPGEGAPGAGFGDFLDGPAPPVRSPPAPTPLPTTTVPAADIPEDLGPPPEPEPVAASENKPSQPSPFAAFAQYKSSSDMPKLAPVRLRSVDKNLDLVKDIIDPAALPVRSASDVYPGRSSYSPSPESEVLADRVHPGSGSSVGTGTVSLGPVVMGPAIGQLASQESLGMRRPRPSVSQGIVEADLPAGAHLAGPGGAREEAAMESAADFPSATNWDSDIYEDEEDVGYVRQTVEDEEWFLTHEVDYPSEEDRGRTRRASLETDDSALSKGAADSGTPPAGDEEVYFSGEEYYLGRSDRKRNGKGEEGEEEAGAEEHEEAEGKHRKERRRRMQGAARWAGLLASGGAQGDAAEGEEGGDEGEGAADNGMEDGEVEGEEEDVLFGGGRSFENLSVGVTASDAAEAGSSLRESIVGGSSEGDADSVKGVPVHFALSAKRSQGGEPGRRAVIAPGEAGASRFGGSREASAAAAAGNSELEEGSWLLQGGSGPKAHAPFAGEAQDRGSIFESSQLEEAAPGGRPSGFDGFGGGGLGGGRFAGFSFHSPSSNEALSRMDSGRSMWSVGDQPQTPERSQTEEAEEAPSGGGADNTLASWKLKSGGSSPMLSPRHTSDPEPEGDTTNDTSEGGRRARDRREIVGFRLRDAKDEVAKIVEADNTARIEERAEQDGVFREANGALGEVDEFGPVEGSMAHEEADFTTLQVGERAAAAGETEGTALNTEATEEYSFHVGVRQDSVDEKPATSVEPKAEGLSSDVLDEFLVLDGSSCAGPEAAEEAGGKAAIVPEGTSEVQGADGRAKETMDQSAPDRALDAQLLLAGQEEYETLQLKVIHRKNRTGFEEDKDFPVVLNSVVAGRYHVTEYLGSAAFSKAIQARDLMTGMDVCMKIIKNNKDFFDQSLDEVKLLKYINRHDPADEHHILRLYDYFYHREHLFIVCELLRANLYEFHKYNREAGGEVYFTMPRLQSIARQCLEALSFMHSLGLIHCDLKPENILVKSYSRCEVKVIDLGSSCFETDHLCSYVQSRSYRAPEVILGLPYGQKIDIWSMGCILAELCSGQVLFQNDSLGTLLARVVGILGPIESDLISQGRDSYKYFTRSQILYERNPETDQLELLIPKKTSLKHRLPMSDPGFVDFVAALLQVDSSKRPTAAEALKHAWLSHPYESTS